MGDKEVDEKIKRMEERKRVKKLKEEIRQREIDYKKQQGEKGKGEGKNYEKFCMTCFIEYQLKDITHCTHCHKELITMEQRHKMLKDKLEVYKKELNKKKFRKMKYENFLKSKEMLHVLDKSHIGPTNYTKWEMYESDDEDEENKEPILPKHDPKFIALEKQMNDDIKRRENDRRKSNKLKEDANNFMKLKKYKKAIQLYSEAIDLTRDQKALYTNRAFAYIKCEEWKNAIDDCNKVIEYYDLFENVEGPDEEIKRNMGIYMKALTRKAFSCEKIKDFDSAKECVEILKEHDNNNNPEILQLESDINHSALLYTQSLNALKIENDSNINVLKDFISLLRNSIKNANPQFEQLKEGFINVKKLIQQKNKDIDIVKQDNDYILYLSISGAFEIIFQFLGSSNNSNSEVLTALLELLEVINESKRYMVLINNVRGYTKLISFLFSNDDKLHIPITVNQATIILGIIESATLDDNCRRTITDLNYLDSMVDIVLKKYDISKIKDEKTANLLTKTFTFICNICYNSEEIRAKISKKVCLIIFKQLNEFINEYKMENTYQRNMLDSILSFLINLACDPSFRSNLSKEQKFLKFLSENLFMELINYELQLNKNENELLNLYEKVASLFYNLTFVPDKEKEIVDYYHQIKIEAFSFYYINTRSNLKNQDYYLSTLRTMMLLFRMAKYNPSIFNKEGNNLSDIVGFMDNLIKLLDAPLERIQLVEYTIKFLICICRDKNIFLTKNKRLNKIINLTINILIRDCGEDASKINKDNNDRIVNTLTLLNSIVGSYPQYVNELKKIIQLIITICKEKTELTRKNAAFLLAKIATSNEELKEYIRSLHGMDILMNISGHLNLKK